MAGDNCMVNVKEDLTGQKFGRWKVLEQADDYIDQYGNHFARWLCECSCAEHTKRIVQQSHLKHNKTQSCGCYNKERIKETHQKINKHDLSGEYGIIWSSNTNEECYFDLEDADAILQHSWYKDNVGYLASTINGKTTRLHVFLGFKWHDHHNRNKLDNRKENLVPCTRQENNRNKSLTSLNKSGVSGVYLYKRSGKWKAQVTINNKTIHLGTFIDKDDAIKARLQAELDYYGGFAPQRHLFEQYKINVEGGDSDN